jgi:hypothetical protein
MNRVYLVKIGSTETGGEEGRFRPCRWRASAPRTAAHFFLNSICSKEDGVGVGGLHSLPHTQTLTHFVREFLHISVTCTADPSNLRRHILNLMDVQKIISGGQTGVDRAALDAAQAHDVPVGGWCPKGRRAEDGSVSETYPLRETPSDEYAQRTAWNVRDSDGTLIIAPAPLEGGTALTREEAEARGRPVLHVRPEDPVPVPMIRAWGAENDVQVLNVAGPRASEVDGIYESACQILGAFLIGLAAE